MLLINCEVLLINCEVSLTSAWFKNCVLIDIKTQIARNANPNADPPVETRERIDAPTNPTFKITDKIVCSSCYFINRR